MAAWSNGSVLSSSFALNPLTLFLEEHVNGGRKIAMAGGRVKRNKASIFVRVLYWVSEFESSNRVEQRKKQSEEGREGKKVKTNERKLCGFS